MFLEDHVLYFCNGDGLCKLDLKLPEDVCGTVEVLVALCPGNNLDVKYLPEEDVIVLVSELGSISVYNLTSSEMEVVGDVAGGIAACRSSPDSEALVVITKTGNILIMTRMWDVTNETPLDQTDFGAGKFVAIGWGSKETQFHGSEGKGARTKKETTSTLADWDDKKPRVVWRADGQFFAVNALEPSLGCRIIRVFDREATLQFSSEAVPQLEQSLSWKSTGASGLITSTVSNLQQGKHQVSFYSRRMVFVMAHLIWLRASEL